MSFLKYIFNPLIDFFIPILAFTLEKIYGQSYAKFFVLETIARIPYFSYLSVLHLLQSLGQHPSIDLMDLHYKETVNEEYHLMIMESLGGNKHWYNRWIARFVGIIYYLVVFVLYLLCPSSAYYLMQKVETHAGKSYTEFLELQKSKLESTLAKGIAKAYYFSSRGRMTDPETNTNYAPTLLDVFTSIRDDELVHVKDMKFCQDMPSLYTSTRGKELQSESII